jgi:hypothetical protein
MILRSISQHVRDQNWFAVGIDFVIVVFGVYVGLQVQEWSDQRALESSEAQYLAELRDEISHNVKLTAGTVEVMNDVVSSGKRALGFLQSDHYCEEDCWRILVDFFAASQVIRPAVSTTVYEETQRLGFPRSLTVKSAVDDYYVLHNTAYLGIDNNPRYRVTLRELISVEAHEQLWSQCHVVNGAVEFLLVDCPPAMSVENIRENLDRLRDMPGLLGQLRYFIGMHSLWIPVFNEMVKQGKQAITVIESEGLKG